MLTETLQLCHLCQLDCGPHPLVSVEGTTQHSFCCLGCQNVFSILSASGLVKAGQDLRETDLFKQSLALGLVSQGQPAAPALAVPQLAPGTPAQEALFHVSGMWCAACAWLIEHVLKSEPGVVSAEVFFASDLVKVSYFPQYLPKEKLHRRIEDLGYRVSEFTGEDSHFDEERRNLLLRIGVAGFLGMNIMTLSLALYVGYFEKISESASHWLPFVLMALATPVVFYAARPILSVAWRGLVNGVVRMETLLAVGILAAYGYSVVEAFRGGEHVYFDTASGIVTLVLAGKFLERTAKEQTSRAISLLYRLMPKKVRLLVSGQEHFRSVEALKPGDVFLVKAGERFPADGVVVAGNSHADESLLTGESAPVAKAPESPVIGGSINTDNVLHVRATHIGNDTTLAQIIRLVEHALSSRSPLERTVDQISRTFVPSVLVIAAVTFGWLWLVGHYPLGEALMRAITVLVIACPCALGMATPLAVTTAVGTASRLGILVRDSGVLETVRKLDTVVFDKTGTVTEGNFALLHVELAGALPHPLSSQPVMSGPNGTSSMSETGSVLSPQSSVLAFLEQYLPGLAGLEVASEHPLGRAVVAFAAEHQVQPKPVEAVTVHKGCGITGLVGSQEIFIGNRTLLAIVGAAPDTNLEATVNGWEQAGQTAVFFGQNQQVAGVLAFGDRLKPEAAAVIRDLQKQHIKVFVVSGDAAATTGWVAKQVGADGFHAEALPQQKADIIKKMQADGLKVGMIGDGINDAPALAQADLGIALGTGTDIAMQAAALVLMKAALSKIHEVFALARKTGSIVRQNLFWAFLYNTLAISLAVTGVLNPIFAALAMFVSSISVIVNSARLRN
ncbi:MAG: heavy metal translocating P-type ATPase [Blastocatellia bacterium]|nr:heavy metal translocating P-type ATPase [Blastocatellia bacterium]